VLIDGKTGWVIGDGKSRKHRRRRRRSHDLDHRREPLGEAGADVVTMRLYHTTTARRAKRIMRDGFRDAVGYYGFPMLHTGGLVQRRACRRQRRCEG
jgi:hypothetical protein